MDFTPLYRHYCKCIEQSLSAFTGGSKTAIGVTLTFDSLALLLRNAGCAVHPDVIYRFIRVLRDQINKNESEGHHQKKQARSDTLNPSSRFPNLLDFPELNRLNETAMQHCTSSTAEVRQTVGGMRSVDKYCRTIAELGEDDRSVVDYLKNVFSTGINGSFRPASISKCNFVRNILIDITAVLLRQKVPDYVSSPARERAKQRNEPCLSKMHCRRMLSFVVQFTRPGHCNGTMYVSRDTRRQETSSSVPLDALVHLAILSDITALRDTVNMSSENEVSALVDFCNDACPPQNCKDMHSSSVISLEDSPSASVLEERSQTTPRTVEYRQLCVSVNNIVKLPKNKSVFCRSTLLDRKECRESIKDETLSKIKSSKEENVSIAELRRVLQAQKERHDDGDFSSVAAAPIQLFDAIIGKYWKSLYEMIGSGVMKECAFRARATLQALYRFKYVFKHKKTKDNSTINHEQGKSENIKVNPVQDTNQECITISMRSLKFLYNIFDFSPSYAINQNFVASLSRLFFSFPEEQQELLLYIIMDAVEEEQLRERELLRTGMPIISQPASAATLASYFHDGEERDFRHRTVKNKKDKKRLSSLRERRSNKASNARGTSYPYNHYCKDETTEEPPLPLEEIQALELQAQLNSSRVLERLSRDTPTLSELRTNDYKTLDLSPERSLSCSQQIQGSLQDSEQSSISVIDIPKSIPVQEAVSKQKEEIESINEPAVRLNPRSIFMSDNPTLVAALRAVEEERSFGVVAVPELTDKNKEKHMCPDETDYKLSLVFRAAHHPPTLFGGSNSRITEAVQQIANEEDIDLVTLLAADERTQEPERYRQMILSLLQRRCETLERTRIQRSLFSSVAPQLREWIDGFLDANTAGPAATAIDALAREARADERRCRSVFNPVGGYLLDSLRDAVDKYEASLGLPRVKDASLVSPKQLSEENFRRIMWEADQEWECINKAAENAGNSALGQTEYHNGVAKFRYRLSKVLYEALSYGIDPAVALRYFIDFYDLNGHALSIARCRANAEEEQSPDMVPNMFFESSLENLPYGAGDFVDADGKYYRRAPFVITKCYCVDLGCPGKGVCAVCRRQKCHDPDPNNGFGRNSKRLKKKILVPGAAESSSSALSRLQRQDDFCGTAKGKEVWIQSSGAKSRAARIDYIPVVHSHGSNKTINVKTVREPLYISQAELQNEVEHTRKEHRRRMFSYTGLDQPFMKQFMSKDLCLSDDFYGRPRHLLVTLKELEKTTTC